MGNSGTQSRNIDSHEYGSIEPQDLFLFLQHFPAETLIVPCHKLTQMSSPVVQVVTMLVLDRRWADTRVGILWLSILTEILPNFLSFTWQMVP